VQHLRLSGDPSADAHAIQTAAAVLRGGGLVAFPTETVYGLGALALEEAAVARIFAAKGRPHTDPLIVHVLESWPRAEVSLGEDPVVDALIAAHWPGPLTVVVPKQPRVPDLVTAGLDHVGLRAPSHPTARALLAATGAPIAAPSANRFSYVSATTADHVIEDLGDAVDVVLDGGPTPGGLESTVVRLDGSRLVVLRHGAVTIDALAASVPAGVSIEETAGEQSASPGRLLRHYSPTTRTWVSTGEGLLSATLDGRVAYFGYRDRPRRLPPGWVGLVLGAAADLDGVGRELFALLRAADRHGYDHLVIELTGASGLGRAIDDRIRRAAHAGAIP
jgi:L-threonylcarbamoyladenylate synthase